MSEKTDGPQETRPPENGQTPPNNKKPKAQGKSYASAAKGKGKIQMTQILQEYIKIREQANNYNKNLIGISFLRLDHKNTKYLNSQP